MLITNIEELNNLTGIGQGNSYESYQVDLGNAEQDHLQPLLGETLYQQLLTDYINEIITTEPDLTLLTLCQAVIANMAVATNLDQRQVHISDQGVTKSEESAYYYQKIEAQNSFLRRGYRAMEQLLAYLEKHITNYPNWVSSPAYYLNRAYLIPSAAAFQQHYNIRGSRRTYLALQPIMKKVERFSVLETIGKPFFDELLLTVANDPGQNAQRKEENNALLNEYLRPAIVYLTVAEAAQELSLTLDANGLYLTENMASSDKTMTQKRANQEQLAIHAQQARDTGQQYLQRLLTYLHASSSDSLYTAFQQSQSWKKANPASTDQREDQPPARKKKIYGF